MIVVFSDNTHLFVFVFDQALPQATILENLVQLFNAESHTIGIKSVSRIDDVIAKYVFYKFVEKMDVYMSLIILSHNDSCNIHAIILLC